MKRWQHILAALIAGTFAVTASPLAVAENADDDSDVDFFPDSEVEKRKAAKDDSSDADSDDDDDTKVAAVDVEADPADNVERKLDISERPAARKRFRFSGYVQPQFSVFYRPKAVPRDRTDYSAARTRTGLVLSGDPIDNFSYNLHVTVSGEVIDSLGGDSESAGNVGGDVDAIASSSIGMRVERAAIDYTPNNNVALSMGQMRIPFSLENQVSNTSLMFPNRSSANEVFLRGSDLGALVKGDLSGKVAVSAGVFHGTDATSSSDPDTRGPLYTARADINPLGAFAPGQRAAESTDLRVGVGAGLIYYPSTHFDTEGFESTKIRDLRASLSVRMAIKGFYLQGEALRRQRTDSLSDRPLVATGAYGQASYYRTVSERFALSPIARIGWTEEDQSFAPRTTRWTEVGVTVFVRSERTEPDDLRFTLQYIGEYRATEGENAHGVVSQMQLKF